MRNRFIIKQTSWHNLNHHDVGQLLTELEASYKKAIITSLAFIALQGTAVAADKASSAA